MFRPVSRKGQRRPFSPDDEWAGLTGHLSHALSLFHLFLGFFWILALFFPPPPTWNLTPLPSTVRRIPPGDRFIDASAKQNTSNSQRRQESHWHGDKIEVPFISAGLPVKCSSYASLKQLDCVPQLRITPPPLAAFWFHNHNGVSSVMFCYFPHLDI